MLISFHDWNHPNLKDCRRWCQWGPFHPEALQVGAEGAEAPTLGPGHQSGLWAQVSASPPICLLRNKVDDSSAIKFSLLRTQERLPGPPASLKSQGLKTETSEEENNP